MRIDNKARARSPIFDDPTCSAELESLRREILARPKVASYLAALKSKRIGLVLSGGGGKGAYEAGVLLALFDSGIRKYCALAGTSVGALNAALCHELCRTGNRGLVMKVWSGMSWRRVIAIHPLRFLLVFTMKLLFFVPALIGTLIMRRWRRAAAAARFRLRFAPGNGSRFDYVLLRAIPFLSWLIIAGGAGAFGGFFATGFAGHAGRAALIYGLFLIMALVGLLLSDVAACYLPFASNAPLRAEAASAIDVVNIWKSGVPVFCTMTGKWRAWDDSLEPVGESRTVTAPTYTDLRKVDSAETVMNCIMQSAAIPELFPAKPVYGKQFIDGGFSDNTPILPVCLEKPDFLIVIYLDDKAYLSDDQPEISDLWLHEQARVFWLYDLIYRIKLHASDPTEQREWQRQRDEMLEQSWQISFFGRDQFLPIVPSQPLGGLLGGTLNFCERKAITLVDLGYRDALAQIEKASHRL